VHLIESLLASQVGFSVVFAFVLINIILLVVTYCIYFERKISAWIQDRYGPNRVGPVGMFQPFADGLKFFMKEEWIPPWSDKGLFVIAPVLMFTLALIGFAIVPWAGDLHWPWMPAGQTVSTLIAGVDIGLLYFLAVSGLGVYAIVLGAWASRSKFPFYGGIRATAQVLSYEIPLALGLFVIVLGVGSVRLEQILTVQTRMWHVWGLPVWPAWNFFLHPVTFLLVLVTAFAETNRLPFDLTEAEQELVGGYHTEYSAMKFGGFYLAEYANMITISAILVVMFWGGWYLPGVSDSAGIGWMILRFVIMWAKIVAFLFFYMWVRWTLPRFRYDQLMHLAWVMLVPLGLLLLAWTAVLTLFGLQATWLAPAGEIVILVLMVAVGAVRSQEITGRQRDLPAERVVQFE
jgi:NADH-quinone oxidoreductase subunit H